MHDNPPWGGQEAAQPRAKGGRAGAKQALTQHSRAGKKANLQMRQMPDHPIEQGPIAGGQAHLVSIGLIHRNDAADELAGVPRMIAQR